MSSPTNDSMARNRKVAILGQDNAHLWFKQMRNWLESEGLYWVIETGALSKNEAPTLSTGSSSGQVPIEAMANLSVKETAAPGTTTYQAAFRQKDAKARYWINLSLNEFDQERIEDADTAKEAWGILRSKYKAKTPSTGRQYLQEYINYKMDSTTPIDEAWQHISRLGTLVLEQRPELKSLCQTQGKLQQLLSSLPKEYQAYKAGIDTRESIEVEDALRILKEAEKELHPEIGAYAGRRGIAAKRDQRPRSPLQDNSQDCYLCKGQGHQMKQCPYMKTAKRAAIEERRNQATKRRSSDQASKLEATLKEIMKELNAVKARQLTRAHNATEQEGTSLDVIVSSDDESRDFKPPAEVATICKENVSTTLRDSWISDSGASSHMTDDLHLFSKPPTIILRKTVITGGGELQAERKGTVVIQDKKGKRLTLQDVLYVPKLGVNLLSGRKLCKSGLRGRFNDKAMHYVSNDGLVVLEAPEESGVYVLKRIYADFDQHACNTSEQTAGALIGQTVDPTLEDHERLPDTKEADQQKLASYRLYHRRFVHLGPAKIAAIHKIDYTPETYCGCQLQVRDLHPGKTD